MDKIYFLTSNQKKAQDFLQFGFGVKEFNQEIIEIKSPDVKEVALYKALDTGLDNIVVEDTSLMVEGAHFWGTDIKHVYEEIQNNSQYDNHRALWQVALCMKKQDKLFISVGDLHGQLKYPALDKGYHFERFFAVNLNNQLIQFENLTNEQKLNMSPRFKALRKMKKAIESKDYSELIAIEQKKVQPWNGDYQQENNSQYKNKIKM